MPTPRDGFSRIRTTFETGIKQALVPANGRAGNAGTVYARARPSRAEITESYFVHQEISVSPWTKWRESLPPSSGRVELVIPYDGHDYFTRQAGADVAWGAAHQQSEAGTAVIGHLLLKDYGATSLRDDLRLPDSHGAVPIEVPVSHVGSDADGRFDHLSTDRQTGVISHEFVPDLPTVIPAQLEVDLFDPDSLELIRTDLRTEEGRRYVDDVIRKIRQQVSFRNDLILRIVIRLTVPANQDGEDSRPKDRDEESRPRDEGEWLKDDGLRPKGDKLRPEVARMTIGWPTITSLGTVRLLIGNHLADEGSDERYHDAPVRYNPVERRLEWEDVPMFWVGGGEGEDVLSYESEVMLLSIKHPGELYKQKILKAHAEVEIPGYLLSGLDARLYDATGRLSRSLQPELTTRVCASADLTLDDAFAKREFSPFQHLFFDEIIPDEMRITDIMTALRDSGFDVKKVWPTPEKTPFDSSTGTVKWFLVATRRTGLGDMDLWIFVEGRNYKTERETTVLGGGVTHKTELQSGELRVFIRGLLARDSTELTHEMNALQQTLRERYERVRQRR